MIERRIRQDDVLSILKNGELIEDYPQDLPFPSGLFFGVTPNGPLHVVAAFDSDADWAYIITAYVPDSEHFEGDYKTRKKS